MNSWQLALVVVVIAFTVGWYMYSPENPVPESIAIHSIPPERVVIEAP